MVKNFRCRGQYYPREQNVKRFPVSDDKVDWNVDYPEYKPTIFTAEKLLSNKRADPDLMNPTGDQKKLCFNQVDGKIDRTSFEGTYQLDKSSGLPMNPKGRTGIMGRGILYYWGPNHAADPVVTTWKRDDKKAIVHDSKSGKPILKFIAIFRKHDLEWAIPGGMVDPGEKVTTTIKREFSEEALNSMSLSKKEYAALKENVDKLFQNGKEIYKGYVDDPRNTDNSWMETVAMNFHDETGDTLSKIKLEAGDDASDVKWIDLSSSVKLYASHSEILKELTVLHKAHW